MKKLLLFLMILFSYNIYSQEFETNFPEKVHWTIYNNVLYEDYNPEEKGTYLVKIAQYIEPKTKNKIWFINYPDYNIIYTIRMVKGELVITASR